MRYLAWVFWAACLIWALGSAHSIRTMVRTGQPPTRQTVNMAMLWLIGLVAMPALGLSPFHMLWWFPVAFIVGGLSLAFPFSLLSIPGQVFGTLCCVGLDQTEVARNAEWQRQFEEHYQQNLGAGLRPEDAKKRAVAVMVDRIRASDNGPRTSHSPDNQENTPVSVKWGAYLAIVCAGACSWSVAARGEPFVSNALRWGGIWLLGNLLLFFLGYLRGK